MKLYTRAYTRNSTLPNVPRQLLPANSFVFAVSFMRPFPPFATQYFTFSPDPTALDGVIAALPRNSLVWTELTQTGYDADSPIVPTGMSSLRTLFPQPPGLKVALSVPPLFDPYAPENSCKLSTGARHKTPPKPGVPFAGEIAVVVNPNDIGNAGFLTGYVDKLFSPPDWLLP
jgi:hypothetical protein